VTHRRSSSAGTRLRRAVQLASLALFIGLLLCARPTPGTPPPGWLKTFFLLDPLILLTTLLAAHTVPPAFLLALFTLAFTVFFGRVFCGWVCPLGTVHAVAGRIVDRWQRRRPADRWTRAHLIKYGVLAVLLVLAALGLNWLVWLDPLVILYRTTVTTLWPAAQGAIEDGAAAIYQSDPHVGDWRVTTFSEPAYRFVRDLLFVKPGQAFLGGGLIVVFFLVIVGLNFMRRRFWCRYLCPLGALLGLAAWRPWLRRVLLPPAAEAGHLHACNQCDVCGMACRAAATSEPGAGWHPQECFGCLNCTASCARGSVAFRWVVPWKRADARNRPAPLHLGRRELLAGAASGLAAGLLLRATPQARGTTYHPALIRPPGARAEREFLARCTACGLCMKICPTGGLQPTLTEAGLAGLWTPKLVPRIGYCDYECNRCGEVCPTAAIEPLSLEDKNRVRIGLAHFDPGRCIPYAYARDCMVCEEHCPVPDKAIFFEPREVATSDGRRITVQRPHVDPERCTGCGICENVCPFRDHPAIRVTSANESRHPDNQPILSGGAGESAYG